METTSWKAYSVKETLCWHCNHAYPFGDDACPKCGAANPNQNLDLAIAQMNGQSPRLFMDDIDGNALASGGF